MKVLRKGNPNCWEIEQTCGHITRFHGCGARLLVDEDDIFVTCYSSYGYKILLYTFKCPECGEITDIPQENIPYRVQSKAMNKYKKENNQ